MTRSDDDAWLLAERRAIGDRIRAIRLDLNLTQEQVFLAVPVSRSVYQGIESGHGNPTIATLLRIARVLHVHVTDLLR
ncbi:MULTISPECIES: helix-turn-helix domain-containing protein [unclassified Streptomyces]|uniref:helix-turn-helix domain-containing protein n=1 Tax=unclassified Streptomyces TaxID=2593676 RepID=UPI00278C89F3|nr:MULTISPECIES: helix-turn-helix transcriptional regulator [unclassified Streptomyces]